MCPRTRNCAANADCGEGECCRLAARFDNVGVCDRLGQQGDGEYLSNDGVSLVIVCICLMVVCVCYVIVCICLVKARRYLVMVCV